MAPWCTVDCYFDQDAGSGNDECYWSHRCDPLEVAPSYHPESCHGERCAHDPNAGIPGTADSCQELAAAQSPSCLEYCGPLTPNGCDCFGCCELPAHGGQFVWLGSDDDCVRSNDGSCEPATVGDLDACQRCTPVPSCLNDCAPCELCIGKTTIGPECGGQQDCAGRPRCGLAGQEPCPVDQYCITGCCQPTPQ